MADGKFLVGKPAGGVTTVTVADGASNTNLVLPESGTVSGVTTVVTDNAIARFDGTTGKLQNSVVTIDDNGNVGIGVTPSSSLSIYKTLEVNGAVLTGHNNKTNAELYSNTYLDSSGVSRYLANSNATYLSMYQGKYTFNVAPSGTAGNVITWTNAMTLDASGNLLLTSGTGGLGYGTGAGGTVTQLTSKSTAVTLNKPSGKITMHNAALAAGASVSFDVINTLYNAGTGDTLSVDAYQYGASYRVEHRGQAGAFTIKVTNIAAASLSEPLEIMFTITKGATA